MNLHELEVILHHSYDPGPYEPRGPATIEAEGRLLKDGLIEPDPVHDRLNTFRVTERGRVFVNALKNVPLPVQAWVSPIPTKES